MAQTRHPNHAASAVAERPGRLIADRLLDTAAALFWEKGYAATTTREIAAALEIQQASLYYHVSSKEDLLYQICISSLTEFLDVIPRALSEVAYPPERIRVLIRTHLATLLRHQKRNVTMLTELRSLSGRRRDEVIQLRETYRNLARTALEDAQAAGKIRADIPAIYLCLALLNMLNWSALWFRKNQRLSESELAEIFVKIYLEGVAAPGQRQQTVAPDLNPQARRPVSRPRKENSTAERLLPAAVALFSRKGYTATSTREVAALLGMQKASLYYHIEGKEDLLYLVCRSSLEQIRTDVEAAVNEFQDPLERVRALISAHIESMLRDQNEHATTLAEMHALSRDRLTEVLALRQAYEALVRKVLADAQSAGALRDDIDAKYLCLSVLGLMNRVLVWYRRRGPLTPGQIGQMLAAVFLNGAAVL